MRVLSILRSPFSRRLKDRILLPYELLLLDLLNQTVSLETVPVCML